MGFVDEKNIKYHQIYTMKMKKFFMTFIIRYCRVYIADAPFHSLAVSFTPTGETVYWAQIFQFPLDSLLSKLCDLNHLNTRALFVMCRLLFTCLFFFSLFLSPLYTFAHIPTPIFTVWTCTDCGQQSIWDNGDCQCNVSHLERERKAAKRKDTFSLVVGVEK